jgi:predicted dehydrogenase
METLTAAVIGRTGRGDYGHGLDLVWNNLPGVKLVAVADDNKMGLASKAKQLKVDKAYSDYRKMLDEVKPSLVSIGCRWLDQHRDMVVEAANRGVHIYLEKPLCRTLAEADEMVDALERTQTKLVCAHTTRHSPKVAVMKQLIADGKIGRILELRGRGKEDQRGGGEDLWVLGTHVMDLIRLFGGDPLWCMSMVNVQHKPATRADVVEGAEGIGP